MSRDHVAANGGELMVTAALLFSLSALAAEPADTLRIWAGDQLVAEVPRTPAGTTWDPRSALEMWSFGRPGPPGSVPAWWTSDETRPPLPEPPVRQELIIVTTAALAGASEHFQAFVDFRSAEGWAVTVGTEADWDTAVDTPRDDRADRIRAWLKEGWGDRPGAFLLLVGDPRADRDGVPMKLVHPLAELADYYPDWLAEELDPIPTDLYYGDLSGSWDCDGDGRFGEHPDDKACVDFGTELYVGRLPVYDDDAGQLDRLLARVLAHDAEQDKSYRGGVLLPAAMISLAGAASPTGDAYSTDDDGACVADRIYSDLPDVRARTTRLYENDGLTTSPYPHEGPLTLDRVIEAWREGNGLVVWYGHGAPEGAYRMYWAADYDGDGTGDDNEFSYPPFVTSSSWQDLETAPSAFTWHISCSNGVPEDKRNIGVTLLDGGAVATASASRLAFGESAPFGEDWFPAIDQAMSATSGYFYAILLLEGATVGEAMAYTKYALSGEGLVDPYWDYSSYSWATKMEFNLYGDPTRSLEGCTLDEDCDDGSACNGTETCSAGYCVHTAAVDCGHLDDSCTVGSCDSETGECIAVSRIDGAGCDDGLWCTVDDTCEAGICGGVERDCGSREGYLAVCVEDESACDLIAEEEPGGCRHAPSNGFWALVFAPLVLTRRRRTR